jgi:hypothetical protein
MKYPIKALIVISIAVFVIVSGAIATTLNPDSAQRKPRASQKNPTQKVSAQTPSDSSVSAPMSPVPANQNPSPSSPQAITVKITSQNNSGESGTATLTNLGNNQTRVDLNLTGFAKGVPQPAHIHSGSCTKLGPVKYPLNPVVDGKSTTIVSGVSLSTLLDELPLAINIHKSPTEINIGTACGDIVKY